MAAPASERSGYEELASRRDQLDRSSRSAQIADIVRGSILDGSFRPGTRLSEPDICSALGVSRNTLREAFRSLVDQRLATHELNRGVFVRVPSRADVGELYTCRRIIEGAGVRDPHGAAELAGVRAALDAAEECARAQDWTGVGTADIAFHKAIAGLNHSMRIDEFMTSVWNELRLVFHVMADPHTFHRPYLDRNREIYEALAAQDVAAAERLLLDYLTDAERQILGAYPR
ncbi:MAG TPA: GntR family transcriptional regulator [Aldersonia sp.]